MRYTVTGHYYAFDKLGFLKYDPKCLTLWGARWSRRFNNSIRESMGFNDWEWVIWDNKLGKVVD